MLLLNLQYKNRVSVDYPERGFSYDPVMISHNFFFI